MFYKLDDLRQVRRAASAKIVYNKTHKQIGESHERRKVQRNYIDARQ